MDTADAVPVHTKVIDFPAEKSAKAKSGKASSAKKAKTNRLSKSIQDLPREIHYDIDVETLDEKHGAGNWRIAFWHEHITLEKIDTPFYQASFIQDALYLPLTTDL